MQREKRLAKINSAHKTTLRKVEEEAKASLEEISESKRSAAFGTNAGWSPRGTLEKLQTQLWRPAKR